METIKITAKLIKTGNSNQVIIPAQILKSLGKKTGDKVTFYLELENKQLFDKGEK